MIYLSSSDDPQPLTATFIARELQLPEKYVSKILQQLCGFGFLVSTRGRHGGYALPEKDNEIALWDVIQKFDEDTLISDCLFSRDECSDQDACPLHDSWDSIRRDILYLLVETKLDSFSQQKNRG